MAKRMSRKSIEKEMEKIVRWLDLLARALEHPEFEKGQLLFSTSDLRERMPVPHTPGKDCRPKADHVSLTLPEAADTLAGARDMARRLLRGLR